MTFLRPTRLLLLAGLCLVLAGAPLLSSAQRGGGGGGGAPGGGAPGGGAPGGGNMGGPGGGGGFGGGNGRMQPNATNGNMGSYRNPAAPNGPMMRPEPMLAPQGAGRFWDERKTARALRLRNDQQHRMDTIFDANKGTLLTLYQNLQREELKLSSMSQADLQDQSKVFAAIDRVAQARAELGKERAFILIQIRQQLDSEQLEKLDHQIAASH